MFEVALASSLSYKRVEVEAAVKRALSELGGIGRFIKPGMNVLIKPNLLTGELPDKGATTHPEVVRAVIREVLESGGKPLVGDSPGVGSLAWVAERTGIAGVCRELGVPLAFFKQSIEITTGDRTKIIKRFPLAAEILNVDAIINLPKMKTHGLARITGCVKNLYGCIVGFRKAELHFRLQRMEMFMEMLIDLAETVKPVLNIVDGITAMEGAGPRNGKIRPMGLIIAGGNAYAVDSVIARLMGKQPEDIPLLALARNRGISGVKEDEIKILGEKIDDFIKQDYQVPSAPIWVKMRVPDLIVNLIRRYVSAYPIIKDNCKGCGVCIRSCPAGIISLSDDTDRVFATIDNSKCIRCYCCQELCPHDAVELKVPVLGRWYYKSAKD